jgi:hypothetical protein
MATVSLTRVFIATVTIILFTIIGCDWFVGAEIALYDYYFEGTNRGFDRELKDVKSWRMDNNNYFRVFGLRLPKLISLLRMIFYELFVCSMSLIYTLSWILHDYPYIWISICLPILLVISKIIQVCSV